MEFVKNVKYNQGARNKSAYQLFVLEVFVWKCYDNNLNCSINLRELMHQRISIDPEVCHGQACIKGKRIPVHQIVSMLANGDTIDDLLKAYPTIDRKDIFACLDYAATLAEEQVTPIEP